MTDRKRLMRDPRPAIGLLHPGRMGAAVGRLLTAAGHRVAWCAAGRSPATAARADEAGLERVADLAGLTAASDVIISLCPPAAAERLAATVAETGFAGTFVEANAVGPARVRHIAGLFTDARVVDGCVIGPPPSGGATARLYLSGPGPEAARVAELFAGSAVEAIVIDGGIGQASALKMAFGSYNKAASALAAVSHALAGTYGVGDHLLAEARRVTADHLAAPERLSGVAARAWRWAPEMDEAAATMADAGLPDELALGAAAVFRRWNDDRDDFTIAVPDALDHLRRD
jgi:3-hydroxyisobutyrate dehydrogenase-like beta-hydroxyacid dehydrogenase